MDPKIPFEFKSIAVWARSRPIVSIMLVALALFGYSKIFVFAFLQSLPVSLRPFLDSYFFSTLTLEFFLSLGLAIVVSRVVVLSLRYILIDFPSNKFLAPGITFVAPMVHPRVDRVTRVHLKLAARTARRYNLLLTFFVALVVFSIIYLGRQSIWYIPICLLAAPVIWAVVSRVELSRKFATPTNTASVSRSRVVRAISGFLIIFAAFCVFSAGFATFAKRLETNVSIGVQGNRLDSSLVAVTSTGIIVATADTWSLNPFPSFKVSAHFLPYSSFSSVGQRFRN